MKTERFDRDPGWEGRNNRTPEQKPARVVQDFGFSPTNHAGGKAAGEIGGPVMRSSRFAYYGKPLERELTLDDELHSSGQFVVTKTGGLSTLTFGWFNSKERGYPSKNLIGVFAEGPNSVGSMFRPIYATSDPKIGAVPKEAPIIDAFGKPHTWKIEYDPDGANGQGELRATLDGKTATLALTAETREQNATFDRFGIAVYEGGGQWHTFYLDDLEFTTGSSNRRDPSDTTDQ